MAVGAYLLAALIVWWAWAARETFQSSLAIAIVAYLFAGGLVQSILHIWRSKFRGSDDETTDDWRFLTKRRVDMTTEVSGRVRRLDVRGLAPRAAKGRAGEPLWPPVWSGRRRHS